MDPTFLRALHQLQQQPGWRDVASWFEQRLERATQVLVEANDDVVVRRAQGEARLAKDFLAAVRQSNEPAGRGADRGALAHRGPR